jgi:DNA-3-methyladenine glycosylase I
MNKNRCQWLPAKDELYANYHDNEWGKPLKDKQAFFELFCLETQHAGLSWRTILGKRESYRQAFYHFDINKITAMTESEIDNIMQNYDVIRYKPKLMAIVNNGRQIVDRQIDFVDYFWQKVDYQPIFETGKTSSNLSDIIAKDLKKLGFKYVGSITIYAFLQACGIINSHDKSCYLHSKL